MATVMVLQKLEECSDREAVERFTFDLRWKYAAGVEGFTDGFVHTVLVNMRARLHDSDDPKRIFRRSRQVAEDAGLIGMKRVLDSTPLYDAVATQDTVTLIRSAIRGLLRVADPDCQARIRGSLRREDDYRRAGKPSCDWDDAQAREIMIDELVRDGLAAISELEGMKLTDEVSQAAELIATVIGQDTELTEDGPFRIARRVAPNRVISTVDPQARHGRKSSAHGFDGYKGHVAIDPDSEIITSAEVGPANQADGEMMGKLLEEFDPAQPEPVPTNKPEPSPTVSGNGLVDRGEPEPDTTIAGDDGGPVLPSEPAPPELVPPVVYGDCAYGSGSGLALVGKLGATPMVKVQTPHGRGGCFPKDRFVIDLVASTVTCPNGQTVVLRQLNDGGGYASFGKACSDCPLRTQCTAAKGGRVISISIHEALLQQARQTQADLGWQADYKANRPKVERKQAHMMSRRHGGRRARVRGQTKVGWRPRFGVKASPEKATDVGSNQKW